MQETEPVCHLWCSNNLLLPTTPADGQTLLTEPWRCFLAQLSFSSTDSVCPIQIGWWCDFNWILFRYGKFSSIQCHSSVSCPLYLGFTFTQFYSGCLNLHRSLQHSGSVYSTLSACINTFPCTQLSSRDKKKLAICIKWMTGDLNKWQ